MTLQELKAKNPVIRQSSKLLVTVLHNAYGLALGVFCGNFAGNWTFLRMFNTGELFDTAQNRVIALRH